MPFCFRSLIWRGVKFPPKGRRGSSFYFCILSRPTLKKRSLPPRGACLLKRHHQKQHSADYRLRCLVWRASFSFWTRTSAILLNVNSSSGQNYSPLSAFVLALSACPPILPPRQIKEQQKKHDTKRGGVRKRG